MPKSSDHLPGDFPASLPWQPRSLIVLGLSCALLTGGCFQQRYEPANWESVADRKTPRPTASRPPVANGSLPAPRGALELNSSGTTLPASTNREAGTSQPANSRGTLPRRGSVPNSGERALPPNSNLRGSTLPRRSELGSAGPTTLPARPGPRQSSTTPSSTTLPERSRLPPMPGRNPNQTIPRRK